jgi:hypothetical protein
MADARDVMVALEVFSRYADPDRADVQAEHDVIYCTGLPPDRVALGHRERLEKAGWTYDTGLGCWKRNV